MPISNYFFVLCFLLLSSLGFADELIIEPEMGEKPLISAMNEAEHALHLVMYGFTDFNLLTPIILQKKRGRNVKLLVERHPYKARDENNKLFRKLNENNIEWQGHIPPFRLIHQKTLLLDGKKAIVMTFNFTRSTFKNERNFALILDNSAQVKEIEAVFVADWHHQPIYQQASNLIWSPENSRQKLLALINQAQHSIDIYAQNISDYEIIGALARVARKHITIRLLTTTKLRKKQEAYLIRSGVVIHYYKKYYVHAKVFIVDQHKAVIGSINLTRASIEDNRELSVITEDQTVLRKLNGIFEKDWKF